MIDLNKIQELNLSCQNDKCNNKIDVFVSHDTETILVNCKVCNETQTHTINRVFIMNSTIIPTTRDNLLINMRKISVNEAKKFLNKTEEPIFSAIGHKATAEILSTIFDSEIKMNRINVDVKKDDIILAFKLRERITEGKILSLKEIQNLEFDFFLLKFK